MMICPEGEEREKGPKEYSNARRNVSVNNGPHIQQWPHKIIMEGRGQNNQQINKKIVE